MVQASAGLPDSAVVAVSGVFEVELLVISPWPLADPNQPCLYWLSLQIRGGDGSTENRAPPERNATRVCEADATWCDSYAAQWRQFGPKSLTESNDDNVWN